MQPFSKNLNLACVIARIFHAESVSSCFEKLLD